MADDNRVGLEKFEDEAAITQVLESITEGVHGSPANARRWPFEEMTWEVPFGWGTVEGSETRGALGIFAEDTRQVFMVDEYGGCGVRKLGTQVKRTLDDRRYLNWKRILGNEVRDPDGQ